MITVLKHDQGVRQLN